MSFILNSVKIVVVNSDYSALCSDEVMWLIAVFVFFKKIFIDKICRLVKRLPKIWNISLLEVDISSLKVKTPKSGCVYSIICLFINDH